MRSSWLVIVAAFAVGCGSVSSKPDAGSPGDGNGRSGNGALALATPRSWVPQTPSGTLTFAADASSTLGSATIVDVQLLDGSKMLDTKPFTVKVSGLPVTLDTTFGNSGKAQVPLPDPAVGGTPGNGYVRAVLTYPASAGANADKILIAVQDNTTGGSTTPATLAVIRLNADGSPDTPFGGGAGYVLLDGSPANIYSPVGIALDSTGRIVVAAICEDVLY